MRDTLRDRPGARVDTLIRLTFVVGPIVVLPATFLLVAVPAAGSWLSGWPSRRALLQWVAFVVLVTGGGSAAVGAATTWSIWAGAIGPWFPFTVVVPDGFQGLTAVELCDHGDPLADRTVAVDDLGTATVALEGWDELYDRHRVRVRERSGLTLDAQSYGYEVDGTRGCSLLLVAVHPTSAYSVPYPSRTGWELVDESRADLVPLDVVAARHPPDEPDPP